LDADWTGLAGNVAEAPQWEHTSSGDAMKIRSRATVMGCAAILAAGLSAGTAHAEETACSAPMWSVPVHLTDPGGSWSYTYQVSWCADNGSVEDIKQHITHQADGTRCVWEHNEEEANTPVHDAAGTWISHNMTAFSCKNAEGKPASVNPWARIAIRPDGSSFVVDRGIDLAVK
jgi:hypothetical protein